MQIIYNLDKTCVSIVQKPRQVLAACGMKRVALITSAKRRQGMAVSAFIKAPGDALPLTFGFLRVRFKDDMRREARHGNYGTAPALG